MKRINNVFEKIVDKNNIQKAIFNASKGKKNRASVKKILNNTVYYTEEIHKILVEGTYNNSGYNKMKIKDGARKKERIIYKPKFYPDQIVHWALMQQIQDILQRGMHEYCCASVPGRGIHYASKYIKKILVKDRKNTKYCLKLDIKKFYPSISQKVLKWKFYKIIKDKKALELIFKIVESTESGLPIGNYTSQWFANYYLQDLDHFIKEDLKVPYYVRYMDDMLLFYRNKKELHKIKNRIEEYLKFEELKLKENWQLFKVDSRPIDFIGYRFYRNYTTIRKSNFLRIKRRIKRIYKKGKLNYKDATAVISYYGWIKHSNSNKIIKKYIKPYVNIKKCKGVVRDENRKQSKARKNHV